MPEGDVAARLTVRSSDLGPREPLGKGGTAIVYRVRQPSVPGVPEIVFKEYKPSTRRHAGHALASGLLTFVNFRDKLTADVRRRWDERIVWPLRVVVSDEGEALGVLMPLIQPSFFQRIAARSGTVSSKPREVDLLFGDPRDLARIGVEPVDVRTRLALVTRVAGAYALMHREGVVVGDISARNVVFDPDLRRPAILVVDADSARIRGHRSPFSSQPHTPHWEPPEALEAARRLPGARRAGDTARVLRLRNVAAVQNTATDVYKFALIVVRVLDPGRQKAVNRDPTRAARALQQLRGQEAAQLLRASCGPASGDRPSMREWYAALSGRPLVAPPAERTRPASPETATIADGARNGNWVYAEGRGWVRRPLPKTP